MQLLQLAANKGKTVSCAIPLWNATFRVLQFDKTMRMHREARLSSVFQIGNWCDRPGNVVEKLLINFPRADGFHLTEAAD